MSSLDDTSLEHIRSSDYYPKRDLVTDDTGMELPFPCLYGESALFLGKTSDGTIAISNFRLVVCYRDSFVNIPLGLVEMIESRDIFLLHIYCKDSRIVRCTFATNDDCLEWYKRLSMALAAPKKLDRVFAFAFHAWLTESDRDSGATSVIDDNPNYPLFADRDSYSFSREVERMGFNLKTAWRITYINQDYKLCSTYPREHIVPKSIEDDDLKSAASFRTSRRIPSVVWRDRNNGAILARCSQPEVGWLGWRNTEDEKLIQELARACAMDYDLPKENGHLVNGNPVVNADVRSQKEQYPVPRKVLILDARSYAAAVANRAKGGGCECPEYYPNCDIQFMNLANIHSVRKSFQALRTLCAGGSDQPNWLSLLETTRWLNHVSGLMRSALLAVNAIDKEAMPVLVHCSDGWDRTPQIVSLAEIMLDPYYRTFEGFQTLVEREWLDFGHKFADRCGHGIHTEDGNERSPVFLQFLDCVHQLLNQFPTAFQFNETFLVKLVQHTYSCLFGTFLCNSGQEREEAKLSRKTFSVWTLLKADNWKVKNYLYSGTPCQVLRPVCQVRSLRLWEAVFLSNTAPLTELRHDDVTDPTETPLLSKTRSCDDIVAALEHTTTLTRTSSDPNLTSDTTHHLTSDAHHLTSDTTHHESKYNNNNLQKELKSLDKRLDVKNDVVRYENRQSCDDIKSENSATESDAESDSTRGSVLKNVEECGFEETLSENEIHVNGVKASDSSTTLKPFTNGISECNGHTNYHNDDHDDIGDDDDDETVGGFNYENNLHGLTRDDLQQEKLESSTDTLTGLDSVNRSHSTPGRLHNGTATSTSTTNGTTTRISTSSDNNNGTSDPFKHAATISTSTTDISDSNVRINLNEKFCFNGQSIRINDLTLNLTSGGSDDVRQSKSCQTDRRASSKNSTTGSESTSSSCPDTPAADNKMCEASYPSRSSLNHLARRIDVDGLTLDVDPIQNRLHQRELDYQQRLLTLERHLRAAKIALYHYASHSNGNRNNGEYMDELCSLPESTGDGELHSLSQASNPASDVSWETIEEKDARMTLWVPDHAVTHCAGCNEEFWIVRRRHHCRNCGRVFCAKCTDYYTTIPQQQLVDPVRVCRTCFYKLQASQSPIFAEISDNLITAAEG